MRQHQQSRFKSKPVVEAGVRTGVLVAQSHTLPQPVISKIMPPVVIRPIPSMYPGYVRSNVIQMSFKLSEWQHYPYEDNMDYDSTAIPKLGSQEQNVTPRYMYKY